MEHGRHNYSLLWVGLVILTVGALPSSFSQTTRRFKFNVEWKKVTRLCHAKQLLTVNGQYPGPTIIVDEGDNVEIKVTNKIAGNTTIHWHGVRQYRTGWADGPAYVTQCPIRGGQSYTYKFSVINQRGTLLWHAHYGWQRLSVHGAFIIKPRNPFPFSAPIQAEIPIIFGEWWNVDVDAMENDIVLYGGGPSGSDAFTINGLPGPLFPCSTKDTFIQTVEPGKTYLLRIINAALNQELFFAIANHTLTVVEADAVYTKPYTTSAIMIAPGQTTNVLITADQNPNPTNMFPMATRAYLTSIFPSDKKHNSGISKTALEAWHQPNILAMYLKKIDKQVVTTISLNLQDCPPGKTCQGYEGKNFLASMNNQSFVRPYMSILESYYKNLTKKVFSKGFPTKPPNAFDYTGVNSLTENMNTGFGTKVLMLPFGTNLEIVFQDTAFLNLENHPIHVHGHNFFIVGAGFGNFDPVQHPKKYNLIDPPERNTVAVPQGGWAAIRLKADNPGVWFIHCHIEVHTTWGLATAFIVQNGPSPNQSIFPPPKDLPTC